MKIINNISSYIQFNKKYLIITLLLGLSFGSFFVIRWRAYHCIYKYLEMHNITKNEIINEDKNWTLLYGGDGSFLLSCNIKGKPQNNIYAIFCNGIDNKVKVSINYSDGGFKENVDLNKE
ncbi:hypothetical protein [Paraclostridium sordellii]|uniref:hypothetical protein n=1 Tax=Paraclostridium sordellii TaxID=1505 RepID=UPI0005E9074D|nr:hypothetical protein [Paeniclostridium sordellii]MDU6247347.1 hypothetical protein [Paeniclostridium sordellii]CEN26450.1 Uncharacterised protein [[Clostridium] sordellii] [Paeniclostridium sordellii]